MESELKKYTLENLKMEFPDERACLDYIIQRQNLPFKVRKAKPRKTYLREGTWTYYSPLSFTIFAKTKVTVDKLFKLIYHLHTGDVKTLRRLSESVDMSARMIHRWKVFLKPYIHPEVPFRTLLDRIIDHKPLM